MVMKLLEIFLNKKYKRLSWFFRTEKSIKEKTDKLHVKWKDYFSSFNRRIQLNAKPYSSYRNIKVEFDLSNYATKSSIKRKHDIADNNVVKKLYMMN